MRVERSVLPKFRYPRTLFAWGEVVEFEDEPIYFASSGGGYVPHIAYIFSIG